MGLVHKRGDGGHASVPCLKHGVQATMEPCAMEIALTVTYAASSTPPFVYDPGAFVIGAVHRPPDA